jgi:hypothetical protein
MLKALSYRVGTLLGRPRRERFLEIFPKDAVGAEIGVFKGEFTRHILDRTRPRELHLIDVWWKLYGETYPDWGAYTDFGRLATREAFEMAQAAVRGHDRRRVAVFHVENDLECLSRFPNGHFDWVYLDSSHDYDQTLKELELLDRKLG